MNKVIISLALLFAAQVFTQPKEELSVEGLILQLGHAEYKQREEASKLLEKRLVKKSKLKLENISSEIFILNVDQIALGKIQELGIDKQDDPEVSHRSKSLLQGLADTADHIRIDGVNFSQDEKGWFVDRIEKESPFNSDIDEILEPYVFDGVPFYFKEITFLCRKGSLDEGNFKVEEFKGENPTLETIVQGLGVFDKSLAGQCDGTVNFSSMTLYSHGPGLPNVVYSRNF